MFRFYFSDYLRNIRERPRSMFFSFLCVVIGVLFAAVFYLYSVYSANAIPNLFEAKDNLRDYDILAEDFINCDHKKFQEYAIKYRGRVVADFKYDENILIRASISVEEGFTEEELLGGENVIILSHDFIEKYGDYSAGDKVTIKEYSFTVKSVGQLMYAPLLSDLLPVFLDSVRTIHQDLAMASLFLPLEYNLFERPALEKELNVRLLLSNDYVALIVLIGCAIALAIICGIIADILLLSVTKRNAYRYAVYRMNGASDDTIHSCMAFNCMMTLAAGLAVGLPGAYFAISALSTDLLPALRIITMELAITTVVTLSISVPMMILFSFENFKRKLLGEDLRMPK